MLVGISPPPMQMAPVIDPRAWYSGQCYHPATSMASQHVPFQDNYLWAAHEQQQLASRLAHTPIDWNACPHCGVWHFPNKCHAIQNTPSRLVVVREVFYPKEVWVLVRYSCGTTESIEEWGSASLLPADAKSFGRALKEANDNAVENVLGRMASRTPYTGPAITPTCSLPHSRNEAAMFPQTHHSPESLKSQTRPTSRPASVAVSRSPATSTRPPRSPPVHFDTLPDDATRQSSEEPQKASAEDSNGSSPARRRRTKFSSLVGIRVSGEEPSEGREQAANNGGKPESRSVDVSARSLSLSLLPGPGPAEKNTAVDSSFLKSCPAISLQVEEPLVGDILFKSVLVVDDDLVNIKVLSRVLKKKGLDITTGEDGIDIIDQCIKQGKRFDLILVDENMRHMNGSTAVTALRRHEKEQQLQPMQIIVTSGNTSKEDIARYHSSGINGFVAKPVNMRAILQAINNYFKYLSRASSAEGDSLDDRDNKFSELQDSDSSPIAYSTKDTEGLVGNLVFGELEIFGRARD